MTTLFVIANHLYDLTFVGQLRNLNVLPKGRYEEQDCSHVVHSIIAIAQHLCNSDPVFVGKLRNLNVYKRVGVRSRTALIWFTLSWPHSLLQQDSANHLHGSDLNVC